MAAEMAALRAKAAATKAKARENAPALLRLLSMEAEAFEACLEKDAKWYDVLEVPKPETSKNMAVFVRTLRGIFEKYDFVRQTGERRCSLGTA